jgi:hypothetical protein
VTGSEVTPSETVKACCAAAYEHDAVALILGASYHPGGLRLTRHLAVSAEIAPGQRVLDIASGPGSTALLLADELGVDVDGVDLGAVSVERATAAALERNLGDRVRFRVGDAERLPFPDDSFDAVISECAFCTFPDKATAAAEMARVVKPGGRVGLTDMTVDPRYLDAELRSLAGWIACLADARPLDEYAAIFREAGLRVTRVESHDDTVEEMIDRIEARLVFLRLARSPVLVDVDVDAVYAGVDLARRAVADGYLGYGLLVADRPGA